jgi:hypothetical protein
VRLKLENLEDSAARDANPANLARGLRCLHPEKAADAIGGRIGHADQRAAEYIPIEADGLVEV